MTNEMPVTIWAYELPVKASCYGEWNADNPTGGPGEAEYVRKDVADALVAAAYEAAARGVLHECWPLDAERSGGIVEMRQYTTRLAIEAVRARTPDDARAALDKLLAEAREEGKNTRLCVTCGRSFPESQPRNAPGKGCPTPEACSIDMTDWEAAQYWRQKPHDERAEWIAMLVEAHEEGAKAEREACAKLALEFGSESEPRAFVAAGARIAAAIRQRGEGE